LNITDVYGIAPKEDEQGKLYLEIEE